MQGVTDEREYLYAVIQTITAGPDLDTILRGVAHLVTEAIACHACFVYFLRDETLELRAASPMYAQLEGQVHIPLGEGLTGWVAKTRRPARIKEGALDDPRVRRAYFPELGDEVYQSLVSVPMLARSGDVIGVITLHAEAPHEFGRAELDFLEVTGSLIAGTIENAHIYEKATERVALLSGVSELSRRLASATDRAEVLRTVASGVRDLVSADRCDVALLEPDGHARLAASSPERRAGDPLPPSDALDAAVSGGGDSSLAARLRKASGTLWEESSDEQYVAPLVAGGKQRGALVVHTRTLSADEEMGIESVAAHAAVALVQIQLIESLREKNMVKDFFVALARPETPTEEIDALARRLGCDLEAAAVVVHVRPWKGLMPNGRRGGPKASGRGGQAWANRVETSLSARFPGVLVDNLERSVRGLIHLGDLSSDEVLSALRDMDWGTFRGDAVAVGLSNTCQGPRSLAAGLEEARSAAEVGALIRGSPGVTGFDDLGPYRYALSAKGAERDRAQQRLYLLVEYDDRRGTRLLDTLDGFLAHRGTLARTARALHVHPNTLRQRLKRIEQLTAIDLQQDDWLSLAIATKVVRLHRMRDAVRKRGSDD